jgi:putative lipase involved disintegration of autophagic bodies
LGDFLITALAVAGKGLLLAVLLDHVSPASKLTCADAQFLTNQSIGNTWFIGSLQGLSFELCAVALSSPHETPPRALSRCLGGP